MKKLFTLLLVACVVSAFPQKTAIVPWPGYDLKKHLDITDAAADNDAARHKGMLRDSIHNNKLSATMLPGGYFSLGTTSGSSASVLDDFCQLSFGHPFSMTSFPAVTIDGVQAIPDETTPVIHTGDTLRFTGQSGMVNIQYSLFFSADKIITLQIDIVNTDSMNHGVAASILYDASLGKWGDGYAFNGSSAITSQTTLSVIPDSIAVWERKTDPHGVGLSLAFPGSAPQQVEVGNWYDLYQHTTTSDLIYDLAIRSSWNEEDLAPAATKHCSISFKLSDPSFNNNYFLRWDLPTALEIVNQVVFPNELTPNAEIYSAAAQNAEMTLDVKGSFATDDWSSAKAFALAQGHNYQQPVVNFNEVYSNTVETVTLTLKKGGVVVDAVERNVFIPSSPFSNAGLDVKIDSMYIDSGRVYVRFTSTIESSGKKIYNIKKTNLTSYFDGQTVNNPTLEKVNTGGSNNTDIVFVLDVTGSMSNEIDAVKSNIIEFTDSLAAKGYDYRLALVTFRDEVADVFDFTASAATFKGYVGLQSADGGDDRPENSLAALTRACSLSFRSNSTRTFIWITDADYHINDQFTKLTPQVVIDTLLATGVRVNTIGATEFQTDFYDQINLNTGGKFYDINGNFRDILLDVTRMPQSGQYLYSFDAGTDFTTAHPFVLEVHYAGLGGYDTIQVQQGKHAGIDDPVIRTYPNPVNEQSVITLSNMENKSCVINLYDMSGQLVQSNSYTSSGKELTIRWADMFSQRLAPGIYAAHASILDATGHSCSSMTMRIYNK